ncbi:MAG TPA: hypothetical protein DCO75_08405 [Fibrobacteres bacterium]|nr:hypothetical protein [Fibrobacterota bacterium]
MALIKPFKGLCYKLDKVSDLEKFTAPPYDMIDDAGIDCLYEKDPLNVVRIIQNKRQAMDMGNKDRHNRAAEFFRQCVLNNSIVKDDKPSVYIYKQEFGTCSSGKETFVRTGAIVLVKLVDYDEGIIFPHEYTLTGPKTDRYELLQATHCHTELVFGIVPDQNRAVYSAIKNAVPGDMRGCFTDENSVEHSLFCNSDPSAADALANAMKNKTILIADGHHRYETALRFAKETGNPAYGYIMMNLVSMADPGLVIRAFHRVLKKYPGTEDIDVLRFLPSFFDCVDMGPASFKTIDSFLKTDTSHQMLFLDSKSRRISGLRINRSGENFLKDNARGMSEAWNHLDVSEINSMVINGIMHLPLDGTVLHDIMDYVNDSARAYNMATSEDSPVHGAFFIHPVNIEAINGIVSGKERMPQKSTNFFPKCYSGLVFNDMENS